MWQNVRELRCERIILFRLEDFREASDSWNHQRRFLQVLLINTNYIQKFLRQWYVLSIAVLIFKFNTNWAGQR